MNHRQHASRHDQAAIRGTRKGRDSALDLTGVAHVDRANVHSERRRHRLGGAELADSLRQGGVSKDRDTRHARRDLLEQLQPFRADTVFKIDKSRALPPGRAKLSTKPAATGSGTITKTIGTVRVAWSSGPVTAPPADRMTSGASAANSTACLGILLASPPPQR